MNGEQPTTRVGQLAVLVAEAGTLLEQARLTTDWDALVARETALRERLAQLLAPPLGSHETAAVRIALQELLALNQQAVAAVEARKTDTFHALQHAALVRRAAKAYGYAASA